MMFRLTELLNYPGENEDMKSTVLLSKPLTVALMFVLADVREESQRLLKL